MLKKPLAVLAIIPIRVYQLAISPWLPVSCRFQPTCSEYAIVAIKEHGLWRGAWLAAKRLGRCHPWGGSGFDPVPHGKACGQKTCNQKIYGHKGGTLSGNTRAS